MTVTMLSRVAEAAAAAVPWTATEIIHSKERRNKIRKQKQR